MMNLEQCCRKIIYDDLVRHCLDAECFRHQSKAEYYFKEDRASYKNYFNRINKDFNRDFNDIRKFFNSSNHLTRKLRRRIIAEARYKYRRELELKKIDDDIFYNPNLKPLNFTTNGDYSKYDEEQEFPDYDSIHLLKLRDLVINEYKKMFYKE